MTGGSPNAIPAGRDAGPSPLERWLRRTIRWWRRSIGAHIAAVSLGLLLCIQLASFEAIRMSLAQHARAGLPVRLEVGERVLASLIERRAETLRQGSAVLAADYGFKTAVLSNDAETIASALGNHGARIGATEAALLGTDFALRAASGDVRALQTVVAEIARDPEARQSTGLVTVIGGRPHQIVLTPMKAPVTVGWVLMGFPLERRLVEDMAALSALHLTLLARPNEAAAWGVTASSEPPSRALAFAAATPRRTAAAPASAGGARGAAAMDPPEEVVVEGERFLVRTRVLAPGVIGLVSISIDDAIRLPRDLQAGVALITLLGFAVFVIGSVYMAQRLTVPMRQLANAAERLGRGDSDTAVEGGHRADEIGQLALAFERMRIRVGEKQAEVLQLAYWDSLTGLPNRAQFREAVRDAIVAATALRSADASGADADADADRPEASPDRNDARKHPPETGIAIVMLNLDRFKHVNDILGYRVGDLLLQRVAERLGREILRAGDMVARLGGDEFAVLLCGAGLDSAQGVATRIGAAFDEPLVLEDHTVDMGAGVGIACWPAHASEADTLLGRAELAMHTAKRKAQGPLVYDASYDASSAQTLSLLTELRRAVEQCEMRLYLQPKLGLQSGKVHGAEALVRWAHPERGLVPPMAFIPFAEQTGFIRTLTLWAFEEGVRHWLMLAAEGYTLSISINLSTRDLLDIELPQKFEALLRKHGAPAECLCLEITESAIMDDPERSLTTLDRLSKLGFRLSIDDFGTGYSSLAYLKRLPVDELKIDRSFVMNMVDDLDDEKIVRSTIDLAHNLGLKVVAEGVETAQVLDALRRLSCDEAQGYHMARPMPAESFPGWAAGWEARTPQPTTTEALETA